MWFLIGFSALIFFFSGIIGDNRISRLRRSNKSNKSVWTSSRNLGILRMVSRIDFHFGNKLVCSGQASHPLEGVLNSYSK